MREPEFRVCDSANCGACQEIRRLRASAAYLWCRLGHPNHTETCQAAKSHWGADE